MKFIILLLAFIHSVSAASINQCDKLAADPYDSNNPQGIIGVYFHDINATAAIKACKIAVEKYPKIIRFQYQLGRAYDKKENYKKAFEWYMKAAKEGNSGAKAMIGTLYYSGQGIEKNYKKALEWFMKAAKEGNSEAEAMIGILYYYGKGIEKNYKKAFEWFMKAAKKGHPYGMSMLGNIYIDGHGVKKDYKKAYEWYLKAVEKDDPFSMARIGSIYYYGWGVDKNYKKAYEWYAKAAQKGDFFSMTKIGEMYYSGLGVEKDYKKAFKWFMKAAKQGDKNAQNFIGIMYLNGYWATKNYKKAFKWFKKAADQGFAPSQNLLGMMYLNGHWVAKNYRKAFKWFQKAAQQDLSEAQANIGFLYLNGKGIQKNYKKAFEWYMEAAKKGNSVGQAQIGYLYFNGFGVKKNYIMSYSWYNLANSNGNKYAKVWLEELEKKLTPNQVILAQSLDPMQEVSPIKKNTNNKKTKPDIYTGTGFFINPHNILTNHHVVKNCQKIEVKRNHFKSIAAVEVIDAVNDLAVLNSEKENQHSLSFRSGKSIRVGNDIVVIGFPLGVLLGSNIKLTTGNVSSLTGLVNDTTRLQMTAPVQPGNSGGPLLDKSAHVVGIVVSRLKQEQNVNLAVKSSVAQMFLDINNVDYNVSESSEKYDTADIADMTKRAIVQVICYQ